MSDIKVNHAHIQIRPSNVESTTCYLDKLIAVWDPVNPEMQTIEYEAMAFVIVKEGVHSLPTWITEAEVEEFHALATDYYRLYFTEDNRLIANDRRGGISIANLTGVTEEEKEISILRQPDGQHEGREYAITPYRHWLFINTAVANQKDKKKTPPLDNQYLLEEYSLQLRNEEGQVGFLPYYTQRYQLDTVFRGEEEVRHSSIAMPFSTVSYPKDNSKANMILPYLMTAERTICGYVAAYFHDRLLGGVSSIKEIPMVSVQYGIGIWHGQEVRVATVEFRPLEYRPCECGHKGCRGVAGGPIDNQLASLLHGMTFIFTDPDLIDASPASSLLN